MTQELADLVELADGCAAGDAHRSRRDRQDEPRRSRRRAALEPRFPDGAWFVGLAALDGPDQVRAAIAHGIGLFDGPERSAAVGLLSFLADRSMVLVLDNMEHVLDAADDVGGGRSRLAGEPGPRHQPGAAPDRRASTKYPSHRWSTTARPLFVERARAVRAGWEPGEDRDGHRRDLPPAGWPPARHRTGGRPGLGALADRRSAIDSRPACPCPEAGFATPRRVSARWRERSPGATTSSARISRHCSIGSGYSRAASTSSRSTSVVGTSAWAGDRLDDLLELADQSLIVAAPTVPGRTRFRMLRTIQSFALNRLAADGLETDVRRRHAEAYLALATQAGPPYRHGATTSNGSIA